jgi:Helix-turn-helix of DDE superfamily endonuclease
MIGKSMLRYQDIAHNTARVRALTTLELDEFADLVPIFETCFMARVRDYTSDGLPRLNRRYTPYKNSPLPTIEDKLLFILVHMKQNLTQEVQGQLFGMVQSDANKWLQLLRPVLHAALQRLEVLPARLPTVVTTADVATSDSTPFFIMMVQNAPFNDQ